MTYATCISENFAIKPKTIHKLLLTTIQCLGSVRFLYFSLISFIYQEGSKDMLQNIYILNKCYFFERSFMK